jgi:hypothetical protein
MAIAPGNDDGFPATGMKAVTNGRLTTLIVGIMSLAVRTGARALRKSLFAILENRKDEISLRSNPTHALRADQSPSIRDNVMALLGQL